MHKKYNIHKDFSLLARIKAPSNLYIYSCTNILAKVLCSLSRVGKHIKVTKVKMKSFDNKKIKIKIYEPKDIEKEAPCLVYFHGGGFVLSGLPYEKQLACRYALGARCKVVYVEYRLAPRFPFPIGVEDCYSALKWVKRNAIKLGIRADKIAIGGDSAGGALAAAVATMSRDRKGPPICFQLLIYPVTDCNQNTASVKKFCDTPICNANVDKSMWHYYLKEGVTESLSYASPIKAKSFKDLPPAYIETAEFDPLCDEAINYARFLKEDGVKVRLVQTKGTVHGFDVIMKSAITKQSIQKRVSALRRGFERPIS